MRITKWLRLIELGDVHWVERIWSTIKRSGIDKMPHLTARLGYYTTLKLRMIDKLIKRLNKECTYLFKQARQHEPRHVFTPATSHEGHALKVDDELKYWIMIDVDSLLFEIDSCCELVKKFLSGVYDHLQIPHDPNKMGIEIVKILEQKKKPIEWFSLLDRERNFYIHEGAPYHAIDISGDRYDLIIMKDNIANFDNPQDYTTLSEINKIVSGFSEGVFALQDHIVKLYDVPDADPKA
jgi:hypothetical protein